MNTDFETPMEALKDWLDSHTPSFESWSRRLKHWGDVPDQPAGFLRRVGVTYEPQGGFTVVILETEVWIYCRSGEDPDTAADSELTLLEQEVLAAMAPDDGYGDERFTIGGKAYWCRPEGRADIAPGDQGPQAIARIPVRITLP